MHVKALSLMTYESCFNGFSPGNYDYRITHFVTMSLRYGNEFYVIEGGIRIMNYVSVMSHHDLA